MFQILYLLLLLIIVLLLVQDHIKKRSFKWKKLSEFPGDPPLPLIGNFLQLGFDADDFALQLYAMWKRHGMKNFRFSIGSNDWIMLSNADDVKTLLQHKSELTKPSDRNKAMDPFFGNSISSSEGKRWRLTRKLMSLSLSNNTLESRVEFVNNYCENLFHHLDNFVEKDGVEMYKYLRPYTFDILSETLLGVETKFLDNLDHTYLHESAKTIRILNENFFSPWRQIHPIFVLTPMYTEMMNSVRALRNNSMNIINSRRKKLQQFQDDIKYSGKKEIYASESTKKLPDSSGLLDNLLLCQNYNGGPFSNKILCDEITLISFAGHYTMAVTISHILYCMSKYPEVQEKVLEEQKLVLNNNMTSDPDNQKLNKMIYLEAVMKESVRFFPTITKIGRELHDDLQFNDGRVAPAGTRVTIFYEALYNNPELYPEPEKFKPERFLQPTDIFGFVPFSAGPRSCIGYRFAWVTMKATLSKLLRRYEFLPGGPGKEPQFVSRVVTESKNGIQLRLRRRNC